MCRGSARAAHRFRTGAAVCGGLGAVLMAFPQGSGRGIKSA